MPRQQGTAFKTAVLSRPKSKNAALVASARNFSTNLPSAAIRAQMRNGNGWQTSGWGFFDTCTEFHYAVTWVGNVLSKAKLTVSKNGTLVDPANDPIAKGALDGLFGGPDGHSEMFRQFGLHLTVAGDCYVIGGPDEDDPDKDQWMIAPASQTTWDGAAGNQTWKVAGVLTYKNPLAIRIWRPHPVQPLQSDSPTRAALPILSELDGLTKHIAAQIDSRLASAGLLILPSEISFSGTPSETGDPETSDSQGADGFIQLLIQTAATAIGNRDDASAVVPIVMQVAGEYIEKIKYLTFWSDLDKQAINMRNEAIRRLGIGMDMPPEILEGTSDMNHWSSWQIEEAAIKVHTEPMLKIITGSLTTGYLQPYVEEFGKNTSDVYTFGYNDTDMRLRPNRSQEAFELWDRGALGSAAMLRETGFDPLDAMTEPERQMWLLLKVASGSATPDMVNAALKLLGVELPGVTGIVTRETITENVNKDGEPVEAPAAPTPTQNPPAPSLEDHPTHELPDTNDADGASLAAAADMLVLRALERAGNKLKNRYNTSVPGVSARDLYRFATVNTANLDFLLDDAWTWLEEVAIRHHADPVQLQSALDGYARMLLIEQKPHDRKLMQTWIDQALNLQAA